MVEQDSLVSQEADIIPRGIPGINAFLDTPEIRESLLFKTAHTIAASLRDYLATKGEHENLPATDEANIYKLEPTFDAIFDPSLPTIAIDSAGTFSGSELLAVASQQRRIDGKPSCNIILISSTTDCAEIVTDSAGGQHLEIQRGMMVTPDGAVFLGELPEPVRADAVDTINMPLLQQCQRGGIATLNVPELIDEYSTKRSVSVFAERAGIRSAARVNLDDMWAANEKAEYVIKPSNGSGGRGVKMFSEVAQREAAEAYYLFLAEHGYEPLIEHRVDSWPLYRRTEALERERLDWNVRALIAHGELVDMYIRMDTLGKPVNKGQGAKAIPLSQLSEYTDSVETATRLTERLLYAGFNLAREVPTGIGGADLTVGSDEEVYVYEINIGQTGGLQTIAQLHDDYRRKILGADILLENWMRAYGLGDLRLSLPVVKREKLDRGLLQILECGIIPVEQAIAGLSENELEQFDPNHMEYALWIEKAYQAERNEAILQELNKRYVELAPLEFFNRIVTLAQIHPRPAQLLAYLPALEEMFPQDQRGAVARMMIYASLYSPK
jgi:glutathione synthase/RimK-type ligase-like ATP-grasp enzyme